MHSTHIFHIKKEDQIKVKESPEVNGDDNRITLTIREDMGDELVLFMSRNKMEQIRQAMLER